MSKPPPKKREPTLRELLERDAKYPLREIGMFDEFNKTPLENSISDIQEERATNEFLKRMKSGYVDYQNQKPVEILANPGEFNPNAPAPKPISMNPAKLLFDILTLASPAGERGDTELVRIRESDNTFGRNKFIKQMAQGFKPQYAPLDNLADRLGARTNYGRNTPEEVYGMTALGNGPAYPRQSKMSKAMGVTNKKGSK